MRVHIAGLLPSAPSSVSITTIMLGTSAVTFESPNVIDPGELPPTRPTRADSSTASTSDGDDEDYQKERESTARLLNDIADLDLEGQPYDPYEHSLPPVEEARLYATSLLKNAEHEEQRPLSLDRTVVLSRPSKSKHLVRKRILSVAWKVLLIVFLFALAIGLGSALARENDKAAIPDDRRRRNRLTQWLAKKKISAKSALQKAGSPQYQAVAWLASVDPLRLEPSRELIQRYVLALLYFATRGTTWNDTANFLSPQHECAWAREEIIMDGFESVAFGVGCNTDLEVETIFLDQNGLKNSLPTELLKLSTLKMVSLTKNELEGALPESGVWPQNLEYLDVRTNRMSGQLPSEIGDLGNLKVLGLSNNDFKGTLPTSWGTLGRLQTLAVDDNALTGSLQNVVRHLTELEFLYADRNEFKETSIDFLRNLDRLRELDVSSNLLSGTVPVHLLQHPTLKVLDLSNNNLSGKIPEALAVNTVLSFLSLRQNELGGQISFSGIPRLQRLTHLDLDSNDLTGPIPNEISSLSDLTYLALGHNTFDPANVPSAVFQLERLRELSLPNCQMNGQIPVFVDLLPNLELLDLSNNKLSGRVPPDVWNLPKLQYLLLDHNSLTGALPTSSPNRGFRLVTLYNNQVFGDINYVCNQSPELDLLAIDCSTGIVCDQTCCPTCCDDGDSSCYSGAVDDYLTWFEGAWEFNYTRADYSFDPLVLAGDSLFQVLP